MNIWHLTGFSFVTLYLGVCVFFYVYQQSFLFHPRTTSKDYKYDFSYPYEEMFYKTPNEGSIHCLKFKAEQSKGVVLYLHGNAGSLRDWGWVYPDFVEYQYDLVLMDYRTYGKSTGKMTEANMHADVSYVYEQLLKDYTADKIVIYGRSIGTGMAVRLAAEKEAKCLMLESPYYSVANIAQKIAPIFPLRLLLKFRFESFKYIEKVKAPIYIIHGTNDQVVPFASGKKLYEVAPEKIKFFEVHNGQHNDLQNFVEFKQMFNEALF